MASMVGGPLDGTWREVDEKVVRLVSYRSPRRNVVVTEGYVTWACGEYVRVGGGPLFQWLGWSDDPPSAS